MKNGFIYILTNELMDNIVKIGQTKRDIKKRCAEISSSTGVAVPYEIAYYKEVEDCVALEREIHKYFKNCRVNKQREFFYLSVDEVIEYIEELTIQSSKDEFIEEEFIEEQIPEEIKLTILDRSQMPIAEIIKSLENKSILKAAALKTYSSGSSTYRKTSKEIQNIKKEILLYKDALEKQYQQYIDSGEIKDIVINKNNNLQKTKTKPLTNSEVIKKL
ncbi:MAG: GIY-YIG nuclease family protein, partial [Cetobacterium sp.]